MATINVFIIHQKFISPQILSIVGVLFKKSKKPVLIRLGSNNDHNGIQIAQLRSMLNHQETNLENKLVLFHTIDEEGKIKSIGNTVFIDTTKKCSIVDHNISLETLLMETIALPKHKLLQESFDEYYQNTKCSAVLTIAHNIRVSKSDSKHIKINFRTFSSHWVDQVTVIDPNYKSIEDIERINTAILLIEAPLDKIQFAGMNKSRRYRFVTKVFPINPKGL